MVEVLEVTPGVARARSKWRYRGDERPTFAEPVGEGEESVWDFPRPPRQEPVAATLRVVAGDRVVASPHRGVRILETAGAPTYYFPPSDVEQDALIDLPGQSLCEWKGLATSFALRGAADDSAVGWRYDTTFPEFLSIRGWCAFYPGVLHCYIGDERVRPQPGGYYGGWVTEGLRGPIKGEPGSGAW